MTRSKALLPQTRFVNPRLSRIGLEVMSLHKFGAAPIRGLVREAHRVDFIQILLVAQGTGEHVVDFETIGLRPARAVIVRPGEVQQWLAQPGLAGEVLLIDPAVAQPASNALVNPAFRLLQWAEWPTALDLGEQDMAACLALVRQLRTETEAPHIDAWSIALARELLLCVLLRLARCAHAQQQMQSVQSLLYRKLQQQLDAEVGRRPTVAWLAQQIGVSTSTLNRACQNSVGRSAKQVVDLRVALEARRILVHQRHRRAAGIFGAHQLPEVLQAPGGFDA